MLHNTDVKEHQTSKKSRFRKIKLDSNKQQSSKTERKKREKHTQTHNKQSRQKNFGLNQNLK